jgi:2-methylcitrate dehydratase PrpD
VSTEEILAQWAADTTFDDLPPSVVDAMKLLTRTIIGTTVAGATADGCEATVDLVKDWGGSPEATIWIHGGKAPVHAAAMANSTMARALDICDAANPGQHIGTSAVPVAFGMAELVGGVRGEEFITALAVGAEIATRLGFAARLDGFDPTGACSIFASGVTAAKILGLDATQMLHTMALTFNRAGSSFQSNIDASLAVRLIEGFISQDGVICAQLAQRGLTGPKHWLEGVWGYFHLFCKDERDVETVAGGLGERWLLESFGYKTRPQCGATISSTDAVLGLLAETDIDADEVDHIDIRMASNQTYYLVGSPFEIGDNPQVNGQFNVRYCVANAIVRKGSSLEHFSEDAVKDPTVGALARRVNTILAPELAEGKRELAARVVVDIHLTDGRVLTCTADRPSGFPPFHKTPEQHLDDFWDHIAYGAKPLAKEDVMTILSLVERLDTLTDVREFVPLLMSRA